MSDTPSIIEQAYPWRAGFFDFGKAKREEVTYFNCCILSRDDADWLITRRAIWREGLRMGHNGLMAFRLNENLAPEVGYKIFMPGSESEHFEDPRCLVHNGKLHISACNFIVLGPHNSRWTGAHQVICNVGLDWRATERFDPVYGRNGPSLMANVGGIHEKNWLWFSCDGVLHMIYAAVPHEVTAWTDTLRFTGEKWVTETQSEIPWQHGEIRGGTNPVRIGDEFLTFFHSSTPWVGKKRQYHMGAYTFEAKPPFRITRITPRPLLSGSPQDYWLPGKPACIFPCGALLKGKEWLVVGGSNDISCFWFRLPHADLESRMVSTLDKKAKTGWLTKTSQLLTSPA